MINKIDVGRCIKSDSPHNDAICQCYKREIPYMFLGNHGVLYACRGWIDYCMAHGDIDFINKSILAKLKEKHGHLDAQYGCDFGKLTFMVCPKPFDLRINISASYLLSKVCRPGECIYHRWATFWPMDTPYEMRTKTERQMRELINCNLLELWVFTKHHNKNGRLAIKSQRELFDQLNKSIKEYEATV